MIDSTATNSDVCFGIRRPDLKEKEPQRFRGKNLEKLALKLLKPCIQMRIDKRSINNFSGLHQPVIDAILKTGAVLNKSPGHSPNRNKLEVGRHCFYCERGRNKETGLKEGNYNK